MLHPSYTELMKIINKESEDDTPVINSRYSIVMATAKRARQIVDGEEPLVQVKGQKPLSVAVEELNQGQIKIIAEDELEDYENDIKEQAAAKEQELIALKEASEATEIEEEVSVEEA